MSLTQVNSAGIADGAIVNADLHSSSDIALSKLNTSGTASSSTFLRGDGAWTTVDLTALSASNLTSGTVPDARFPATLPAVSGTQLTNLNASNISSGTLAAARLPASYAVLSGSTDNTIATVTGSNALTGEANLTFDGTKLGVGTSSPSARVEIRDTIGGGGGTGLILNDIGSSGASEGLHIEWRSGSDKQADQVRIGQTANGTGSGSNFFVATNHQDSGSSTERLRVNHVGQVWIGSHSQYGSNDKNLANSGVAITAAGENALKVLDSTSYASDVGGAILMGGNYRSSGDTQPFVELKSFKENGTDTNYAYGFRIGTTPNSGSITERLRIDSNGDLGLGIAAVPQDSGAKTLHIHHPTSGNPARAHIRLTTGTSGSAASNGALLGLDYSNNLYLYNHENGDLRVGTNDTERLRIDSSGKLLVGSSFNANSDGYKMSIKESSSENAAIMFLDTDNMKGGICGISKGANQIFTGTANVDFVVGSLYADTHIVASPANVANTVIAMTVQHDRIQLWENVLISNNVVLTGNTNSNIISERVQILPSENNGYDDSHILSAAQTSGNWEQGNSSSNPSSSWGWIWQYANASNGTKQVRSGIAYDHKGTEEFKYWSSYGDHTWYVDSGASGDETAETCDKKAMQICRQGSVINTANPTYGIYTHTGVQTSNGGSKTVQYLEDCMGQWIVVAKIQQSSHLQGAMASVAQIDTSTGQATGTEWSASFGDVYPVAVRYVSSSNWKNWRDHRGVDFIHGVPHGRKWKNFFSDGRSSGMNDATGGVGSTKYGWTCDGAWDGKGRWHNPTFTWWRMSDIGSTACVVDQTFFTTPTASNAATALDLDNANDAKFGVHATGATGGQDTEVTSVYGYDDNAYGHEDNYPSAPANNSGSDITAMPLWICINVSAVGQFH